MPHAALPDISIVIPLYNEAAGLKIFHAELITVLHTLGRSFEVIYCDDGSLDKTAEIARELHGRDGRIKLVALSRNFGKEYALSAGLEAAQGKAIMMLDGDGQHPIELIPRFIEEWSKGVQVVIGVRSSNSSEGRIRRFNSRAFYRIFNRLTGQKLLPGSTDFRLVDRAVQQAFLKLHETDRITRGLIDWLGFRREYIYFDAKPRMAGDVSYSRRKLVELAANSFVSMSPVPLFMFGYLGVCITFISFVLGVVVFFEQLILNDPLRWHFTGTAMLSILLLFLVGLVLLSQGILSLYISRIHNQSKQRPLFVIDRSRSAGIGNDEPAA